MPPKRAASAASKVGNSNKKARSTTPVTDAAAEEDWETASSSTTDENDVPKVKTKSSKRWSPVSVSRNLDVGYHMQTADPAKAYEFVCLCQPPFSNGNDSDEYDEADEDDEEENATTEKQKPEKVRCDGGKKCLCNKPAADHPDHIWVLSSAGRIKFFAQRDHADLRDPDNFSMYTFNDHAAYGILEVVQNLILDFEEAKGNWKEMWAVVEALTFFLKTDVGMFFARMDDGEGAEAVSKLVVRLFMNMLAYLEREGLLKKESEIKNLGLIMALWMSLPGDFTSYNLLEESSKESLGPAKDKKKWQPHLCANQIAAYAKKHEIKLVGPHDLDEILEDVDDEADLPNPESNTEKADVYRYAKAFRAYKKDYGGVPSMMAGFARKRPGNQPMGGDSLDITSWTSAERKKAAFSNKDPLGKKELDAIKQGMVVSLG